MILTCTHCGDTFRITADQLGTRGKCPHCKATIILPRAANREIETGEIRNPDIRTERWLSLLGTVFLHVAALAILALVPWQEIPARSSSEGEAVTLGAASQLAMTFPAETGPPADSVTTDSTRRVVELFSEQMVSPSPAAETTSQPHNLQVPGSGDQGELQNDALEFFRSSGEGVDEFEQLIAQLQQDGLEIVITFDSTGSMEGEILEVKRKIERMGGVLFRMIPKTRISICTYRDTGARYLVKGIPLTDDLGEVVRFLEDITAAGGGDDPEAVNAGLEWAIRQNRFRERARKVILLFGDSPPHAADLDDCLRLASEFRRQSGGVVSTVTCHSAQRLPAFIEIAQMGGGEAFLTRDEQEIMSRLLVLVFGSQYRDKVIEAFNMMYRQD